MEAMIRRDSERTMALWIVLKCLRDCWLIYAIRCASLLTLFCVFFCFHIKCLLIHRVALKALTTLITSNHVLSGRWREELGNGRKSGKSMITTSKARENFFWLIIFFRLPGNGIQTIWIINKFHRFKSPAWWQWALKTKNKMLHDTWKKEN